MSHSRVRLLRQIVVLAVASVMTVPAALYAAAARESTMPPAVIDVGK